MKVNGYRIELAEVEAALLAHPKVEFCVVIVRKAQLIAYVTSAGEGVLSAKDIDHLRLFIGRSLPSYMIPS